jgi:L-galactono-1,5-lactonase
MIVDAHLHLWDCLHGQIDGKPVVALGGGMVRLGDTPLLMMPATHLDCRVLAEHALAEFDAAGVDLGVVVQETMDGPQNDYLLEAARRFPGRFFVHALPDFLDPDNAAAEARALIGRGFQGIKLPALRLLGKTRLDDARFLPLWEQMAAQDLVLAVDLAPGDAQVGEMHAILQRFPKLRVALGHLGLVTRGDWLSQIRLCRYENVYVETGGIIWLYRDEGYPFPQAIASIERARDEVGIEKIMWGSDWPRTMVDFTYRQSLDFIRVADQKFSAVEKSLLLGENAARLYRLERPSAEHLPVKRITED